MKLFISLLILIPCLLRAEWEQLFSVDEDPTLFHHVNVITGNLNLSIEEGMIAGAIPLPIVRTYSSAGALERTRHNFDLHLKELQNGWHIQGGWNYFPHANLLIEPGRDKEYFKAYIPEKGGNVIQYVYNRTSEKNKKILYLTPEKGSSAGHFSARTDPQNNVLILNVETGNAYLKLPDGGQRRYFGPTLDKYKKRHRGRCYYHLIDDITPSKHKILYIYNDKAHLHQMQYLSPKGNKIFSALTFTHTRLDPPFAFELKGSDATSIRYQATHHEQREYLNRTESNRRALEEIKYCPGRKGIGARMEELRLDGKLQLRVSYYSPTSKKEENTWHEQPEKKSYSADKVSKIEAPVGPHNSLVTVARFEYHLGYTDVYDVENLLTRYHHNEGLLQTIEHFDHNRQYALVQRIHYEGTRISSKMLYGPQGQELYSKSFKYDQVGNVKEEILAGDLTGEGKSTLSRYFEYDKRINLPTLEREEGGLTTRYWYLGQTDLPQAKYTYFQDKLVMREFFYYDDDHLLIAETLDNGTAYPRDDLSGATKRFIKRYQRDPTHCQPTSILEAYWDFGAQREVQIKRVELSYTNGRVTGEALYDSQNNHRYTLHTEYNAQGLPIKKTNPLGQESTYQYNNLGHLTASQEVGTLKKVCTYNEGGLPITCEEIKPSGERKVTRSTYDAKGRLLTESDFRGNQTTQKYDCFGHCTASQFPITKDGYHTVYTPTLQYSCDLMGNIASTTTLKEERTQTTYNILRKPTQIVQSDGTTIRHRYTKNGTLAATFYPDNTEIHYTHDHFQRMIHKKVLSATKQVVSEEKWHYDAFHLLSYTTPVGLTTHYFYDGAGRKIREETGGRVKTFHYDALGILEKTIEGETAHIELHDIGGRITQQWEEDLSTGHIENKMTFFYDTNNRKVKVIRITSQGEATDHFTYDDEGRMTRHTDPLGHVTEFLYHEYFRNDLNQSVLQKTLIDPLKNRTIETFDATGRPVKMQKQNPSGSLVAQEEFFYDQGGNQVERKSTVFQDDRSIKTISLYFDYDQAGRVTKMREPHGKTTSFRYNIKGKIAHKTLPSGVTFTYEYDTLDRMTEMRSSDGTIHYQFGYGLAPKPTQIRDLVNHLTLDLEYTLHGELKDERNELGHHLHWDYDTLGRTQALTFTDGSTLTYQYRGPHLTSVQRNSSTLAYTHHYLDFDQNGHVIKESLINGLGEMTTSYDLLERLSTHNCPWMEGSLTYGPSGLITQSHNSLTTTKDYAHDPLNQLTKEGETHYHFDSLGNPIQWETNDLNQVTTTEDSTLLYDANGNLRERLTAGGNTLYAYDALNRLVTVTTSYKKITFLYDPLSRLRSKTIYISSNTTWEKESEILYLYDQQHEIGTQDHQGHITELKVLGLGLMGDIGAAVALELKDTLYAPLHDLNGHLIALINTSGEVHEVYELDAFGKESTKGQTRQTSPWRFNSKRHEEGLVFFGKRFYDPSLGRWLTPDPAGHSDGPNLYSYVHNSPLNRLDLFGLSSEPKKAPFTLPEFRMDIPIHKFSTLSNQNNFLTADVYVNGKGPDRIQFGCDWSQLKFTPEELAADRVNLVDHFHEIVPQNYNGIGVISLINGINVSRTGKKAHNQYLYSTIPELSQGTIYVDYYNKSRGFVGDLGRLLIEHATIGTAVINKFRQFLVAFEEHLHKINPSLLWLNIAHSEGGIITYHAIKGMTPEQQKKMQGKLLSITVGSIAPIPPDYVKDTHNIYSNLDFAAIPFMVDYYFFGLISRLTNNGSSGNQNIRFAPNKSRFKDRIFGIVDHNFLSPTYQEELNYRISDMREGYGIYYKNNR